MAYISLVSSTSSSIMVCVSGLDTNYSKDGRIINWYLDGKYKTYSTLNANIGTSPIVTFSGLSPSTSYVIKANIYEDNSGTGTLFASLEKTVSTTAEAPTRPSKFSWTTPKVQDKDYAVTATEWNALTANINAVRKYKNLSSYSFTTARPGDDFTYTIYNQAVNAIKGISGYGASLSTVQRGYSVTAKRLNDLVTEINSVT